MDPTRPPVTPDPRRRGGRPLSAPGGGDDRGTDGPEASGPLSGRVINGLAWMFVGAGGQAFLQIVVLAVLARLVSPEEFGVVSAALIPLNLSAIFAESGIGPALVQLRQADTRYLRVGLTFQVLAGAALWGILVLSADSIAGLLQIERLASILPVMTSVLLIRAVTLGDYLLLRALAYRRLALIELVSYLFGYGVVSVVLAILGYGVWAIVIGNVCQASLRTAILWKVQPHAARPLMDLKILKELLGYGTGYTLAWWANYVARQGDNFIVGRYLGAAALGLYGRAYGLMRMPAMLFGQVVNNVLFPAMASVQDDKVRLRRAYLHAVAVLAMVVLPLSALTAVLSREVILAVLGRDWLPLGAAFNVMVFGMLFRTSYKLSDSLASATGAVYSRAWRQGVYALMIVVGALIGQNWGIQGVAVGTLLALGINFGLMAHLSLRLVGTTWRSFGLAHLPGATLAVIAAAAALPVARSVRSAGGGTLSTLVLTSAAAGLACLAVVRATPFVPAARPLVESTGEILRVVARRRSRAGRAVLLVLGPHYRSEGSRGRGRVAVPGAAPAAPTDRAEVPHPPRTTPVPAGGTGRLLPLRPGPAAPGDAGRRRTAFNIGDDRGGGSEVTRQNQNPLAALSRGALRTAGPDPATAGPRPPRTTRDAVFAVLWLFVLAIPSLNVIEFASVGTLSRVVGLALVPVAAFSLLRDGRRRRLLDFHILALAFLGWSLLSLLWTVALDRSFTQVFTLAQLVVMVCCIWEFAPERRHQLSLLRAYVLGSAVTAVVLLSQATDPLNDARRYTVGGAHPNSVAFTLCLAIPMAWYLGLLSTRTWSRIAYRLFIPASLIGIVLTGSRSALVVAGAGLLIIPLTLDRAKVKALASVGVLMAAATFGMQLVPSGPLERLSTFGAEIQDGDLNGRTMLWETSWALFTDRPLIGVGAGASSEEIEEIEGREKVSHNTFLTVATELGAVGLALFGLVLLTVGKRALGGGGLDRRFAAVLLLVLVLGLQPRSWDHEKATWVVLALLVGHAARTEAVATNRSLAAARAGTMATVGTGAGPR